MFSAVRDTREYAQTAALMQYGSVWIRKEAGARSRRAGMMRSVTRACAVCGEPGAQENHHEAEHGPRTEVLVEQNDAKKQCHRRVDVRHNCGTRRTGTPDYVHEEQQCDSR